MPFRSHVLRSFDLRTFSNRLLFGMIGLLGLGSLYLWIIGTTGEVFWAAPQALITWAIAREFDPDHDWTALIAGAGAGLWVLSGQPIAPALALVGLIMAVRLVVNTTGRRPLLTDLIGMAVLATAISYTSTGWVMGFALAVGVYVDDRMWSDGSNPAAVVSAVAGALGGSVVASLSGALPDHAPRVDPVAVTVFGVIALIAVLRSPPTPTAVVDSRMKFPIPEARLHAGRSLAAVSVFIAGALAGPEAPFLYPVAAAMFLGLVSAEIARH